MQLRRVLGQSAIARLLVSEDVLDDVKRMLNLRSNTGLGLLELLAQPSCLRIGQRTALTGTQSNVPCHRVILIFFAPLNTLVARITEGRGLVAMQQRLRLGDVAHISGSGDQRMGQSRISIHANVRLHTKMPLISLLGLVHFRVALTVSIFVEQGASMMVADTTVPSLSINHLAVSRVLMPEKIRSVRLFPSSWRRNLSEDDATGAASRLRSQ